MLKAKSFTPSSAGAKDWDGEGSPDVRSLFCPGQGCSSTHQAGLWCPRGCSLTQLPDGTSALHCTEIPIAFPEEGNSAFPLGRRFGAAIPLQGSSSQAVLGESHHRARPLVCGGRSCLPRWGNPLLASGLSPGGPVFLTFHSCLC